jgi:hypothetical protein
MAARKSLLTRFALGLAVFAAIMLSLSWFFMARWSEVGGASQNQAAAAFAEAWARAGAGTPYVEISAAGSVRVNREQELGQPVELETLHLLAWEPGDMRMARIAFPFWFVRMKLSSTINLGTMIASFAGDWENIDLGITEDDLERRGPALILDHTLAGGARVMLWTE